MWGGLFWLKARMTEELEQAQITMTQAELDRQFNHPRTVYSVIDTMIRFVEIADRTFKRDAIIEAAAVFRLANIELLR